MAAKAFLTTGTPPALIGDGRGRYKILIIGNSGTGKSTLGRELAAILNVPYISLDTLFWQPNWKETPDDEFRAKVAAVIQRNPNGWVVDGHYKRKLGNMVVTAASDVIWLDPPLLLYFPRLIIRTFLRLLGLCEPCSPGCSETVRDVFFSRTSIVWWCLSHHWVSREHGWEAMREIGLREVAGLDATGKMRRIGGWGGELKQWLEKVRVMRRVNCP